MQKQFKTTSTGHQLQGDTLLQCFFFCFLDAVVLKGPLHDRTYTDFSKFRGHFVTMISFWFRQQQSIVFFGSLFFGCCNRDLLVQKRPKLCLLNGNMIFMRD